MGHIYLYTGDGAGKTTNALGLALRSLGHGHDVLVIQFMKWWENTGECKFTHRNYMIYQYGREGWHGKDNLTKEDKHLAREGLYRTWRCAPFYSLVILDELNLAVAWGLLEEEAVLEVLDDIVQYTDVVITGRHAPKALIDRADFVNEITTIKAPKEMVSKEGIQY